MKRITFFLIICLLVGSAGCAPKPQAYFPTEEWRTATPEEQGMDSELLANMFQQAADQQLNLHSLLIVRNGVLVTEAYFQPYTASQPQYLASVTKSVIATLVGIAIQQGKIKSVDQALLSFFPDKTIANLDVQKQAVTLKHLLSLMAGLKCNDSPLSGEVGMEGSKDWVQFMLDQPMSEPAGTKWNYCSGAVHLLAAVLEKSTGMSAREYANQNLFAPIGVPAVAEDRWSKDPQGVNTGPFGLYLTPRDMAKLGYLYLNNGRWGNQQVVPAAWIKESTTAYATKNNGLKYGYLWTVDPQQGSYSALGFAGQQIYVIPGKNLVVVFTGSLPSYGVDMDFIPIKTLVDQFILPAAKSDKALPANSAAVAKLNGLIQKAANPKQDAMIPDGAMQWSGLVYNLEPNPNQWETITFDIQKGANTVGVTINGQPVDPQIGLDNLFRVQQQPDVYAPTAMRGRWVDDHTLLVRLTNLGELADNDVQISFSKDAVELAIHGVINNQELKLRGVLSQ